MEAIVKPFNMRAFVFVVLAVVLLTACAPAVTPAPTSAPVQATATSAPKAVEPTKAAEPTKALAPTQSGGATQAPAAQPAAAGGKVTYKLVPGESKVTYEVGETFLNQNNRFNLAVGVTTQVSGEISGDKASPAAASLGPIEIDISQFKSDNSRRDDYIRSNGLESKKYPTAKFVSTKIDALPASYAEGQEVTFKVTGDLTIKTTTKPVTWTVTTKLAGSTLTGKATTELLMSEFGVGPISILGMLNTEDKVKLTFDFVAKP